jgi:C_GCAxxG_C_C family probable redox protein
MEGHKGGIPLEEHGKKAVETLKKGYNCAQSVLFAYAADLGLDPVVALKISSGFGGGMGRIQSVCGAVTGAFMAIGYRYGGYRLGMTKEGDSAAKENTYSLVKRFADEFRQVHGSILCSDILGCDLNTPEGQKHYKNNNLADKCARCVGDAAELLTKYLSGALSP